MSKIKFFLFFVIFFLNNSIFAATIVLYVNGINGEYEKNYAAQDKLKKVIQDSGFESKFSDARYRSFYNPSDGFIDDKLELFTQASLSGAALEQTKKADVTATADSTSYRTLLGNIYKNEIDLGNANSEKITHIYSVVRDFSRYLGTQILTNNNQVIVVSHSQGNFFSEAVNAYLSVSKTTAEFEKISKNLRFVGVASVAASTPNNRYISALDDLALDAHQIATAVIPNFSILPRNIQYCSIANNLCKSYLIAKTFDPSLHGFLEIYTSDLIEKVTNIPFYKILSNLISNSFDELVANRLINILSHPLQQTQNVGSTATFNVVATGTDLTYQWQVSTDSAATWVNVTAGTGATTANYTTQAATLGMNGYLYRVLVTNSAGNAATSNTALLTVTSTPTPPVATGLLPDTGITATQCLAAGSDAFVDCTSAAAIALSPTQDGMVGRDVTSPGSADGKLGFSYSTVGSYPITDCVKDNITGLVWEGKPQAGFRAGSSTYDRQATTDFISAVNAAQICGFNDWRLPTPNELQSLVDYGEATALPKVSSNWFPNTMPSEYRTSSPFYNGDYFFIDFGNGRLGSGYLNCGDGRACVRLVRGTLIEPIYTYSADGSEVADTKTGLIWRRCSEGQTWSGSTCTGTAVTYTYENALLRAKNEANASGKAWRVPNVKELSSITKLGEAVNPSIDTSAFPGTPANQFWSSSPYVGGPNGAWYVNFNYGYVGGNFRYGNGNVRLVR